MQKIENQVYDTHKIRAKQTKPASAPVTSRSVTQALCVFVSESIYLTSHIRETLGSHRLNRNQLLASSLEKVGSFSSARLYNQCSFYTMVYPRPLSLPGRFFLPFFPGLHRSTLDTVAHIKWSDLICRKLMYAPRKRTPNYRFHVHC